MSFRLCPQAYLLESALTVLTLVSNPSSVADACPIDAFPGETVFLTGFRGRGVRDEHQVKHNAPE